MLSVKNLPHHGSLLRGAVKYLDLIKKSDVFFSISTNPQNPYGIAKAVAFKLVGDFRSLPAATVDEDASLTSLPSVLCVGTIEPRKNQTRVLRAMVAAQDAGQQFRGIFVGNAGWLNGQFRTELQQARSRGIELELHENISDELLAEVYQNASLTVYCSVAEGFGLPIVESVMAGVPCLVSRLGSMKEIVINSEAVVL
jgi:glycosyltransferase involved in cell wall biosynthesis